VVNSGKDVPEGNTRGIINSKENLKVTEHLGGRTVQRRAQRENEISKDSVKLFQVGIEQVQGVHQGTLFQVQ
jgi:hypothetical protein